MHPLHMQLSISSRTMNFSSGLYLPPTKVECAFYIHPNIFQNAPPRQDKCKKKIVQVPSTFPLKEIPRISSNNKHDPFPFLDNGDRCLLRGTAFWNRICQFITFWGWGAGRVVYIPINIFGHSYTTSLTIEISSSPI